jgi:hypothetical protein
MLYADRHLFVDNAREFVQYGQSLVDYSGIPDRRVEVACSSIDRAIEVHEAQQLCR